MRRRQKRVPNTAQPSLGFIAKDETRDKAARPKVRVGATAFIDTSPWHLYIGPERIDDYLSKRGLDWVVKLREELHQVDFSSLESNYAGCGRAPYHPRMMMGLLVYGVLQGKQSLRELEGLAVTDVGAWLVCAGQQPDHSTIGDFLERHREEITQEYFKDLVSGLATRKGVKAGVVAGDGTVIEASASRFTLLSREAAEQAAQKAQARATDHADNEALQAEAQQAQTVAEVARERAGHKHSKGVKDAERVSVVTSVEPEAVPQKCKDGRFRPAYKPSILVHESGLIVGQVVEASSESVAVSELFNQHQAVFGANPHTALFDAGYHNHVVLAEALRRGIDVLCPSGKTLDEQWQRRGNRGKFGKTQFHYDPQTDRYQCPAGHWLVAGAEYRDTSTGQRARKYSTAQCGSCPLRTRCTQNKAGRQIIRFEGDELKEAMETVMSHPRARHLYRLRREIAERPFAELKARQRLGRFRRRGRAGAALEFALHCIAHNLKWALNRRSQELVRAFMRHLARIWCTSAVRRVKSHPYAARVDSRWPAAA